MTRILLTLIVITSFSTLTNAQFKKGDILLGGGLGFGGTKDGGNQGYNAYINASLGKAVNENTVFGINAIYSPFWNNYYNNYGLTGLVYINNNYTLGIYYRKYKNLGKGFFIFLEAGAAYLGSTESGKDSVKTKVLTGQTSGGQIYAMPGISYKFSPKFFLEITLPNLLLIQYKAQTTTVQSINYVDTNSFSFNSSLSSGPLDYLEIGFRLNL